MEQRLRSERNIFARLSYTVGEVRAQMERCGVETTPSNVRKCVEYTQRMVRSAIEQAGEEFEFYALNGLEGDEAEGGPLCRAAATAATAQREGGDDAPV